MGFSTGGAIGSQFTGNLANTLLSGMNSSGHDEGTTQSAISSGNIIIRDSASQTQDTATLSRDTETANGGIGEIFDKEKEQQRIQQAQLISEIGVQATDIARAEGEIAGTKAKKDPAALQSARELLAGKGNLNPSAEEVAKQAYNTAMAPYGTGSALQQGMQAATAAIQGLAGGNMGQVVSGATAPYLAEQIHTLTEGNPAAQAMAHAVVGAITSYAAGNSALASAAGAVSGELMAQRVMKELYQDKSANDLTETEKQTISVLGTLAAGLAGGVTGGSTADAVAGAQTGQNAVENNYLSSTQALSFDKELSDCRKSGGNCQAVIDKWKQVSDEQSAKVDERLENDPLMAQGWDKEVAQGGYDMTERPGWLSSIGGDVMTSDEAKAYVQQWNGQDLAKIDQNSPGWTKFAVFISDPENQAMLVSGGLLAKDLVQLAKATVTNLSQGGTPFAIKSMQVGLRNPQQVDQLKNDMISGNYKFTAPEGRIAGYIDSKGNYYISEGNHRMVAAQEIYKKTGDASYIEKLIQNGSWTQTKNAPAGASSMPTRK